MSNDELEKAFNGLADRIKKLERLINSATSVVQLNAVSLLLEQRILELESENTTLKNRLASLEARHEGA